MREDEEEVFVPFDIEQDDTEIATELPSTVKEPEDEPWTMPGSDPVAVPTPGPTPTPAQTPTPAEGVGSPQFDYEPEEFQQGNNALFISKAGEAEFVAPDLVESAIKDGYEPALFHVNPNETYPATGQPSRIAVPKSQLANAKKDGLIPVFDWHARQQVEKAKNELPMTAKEAYGRGTGAMFSLGQTANIAGGKAALLDFLKNFEAKRLPGAFDAGRDVYRLEESAAKKQFPAEYMGGEATGFAASLPIGGVAKSLGGAALRAGGLGVATGLAGGVEYPTPGEEQMPAWQRAALSGGLSAGLGAGGHKLGQVIGQKMAPKLESIANSRAVKSVQPTISQKFARNVDRLPGGEQALGRDALKEGLIKSGNSVDDIAEKAIDLKQRAGKKISNILDQLDQTSEGLQAGQASLQNILSRVDQEVMAPLASTMAKKDVAAKVENAFVKHLREAAQSGENIGFQALHAERASLDDLAYTPNGIDKILHKELQKIRRIFEDEIFKGADRVVQKGGPALKNDYVQAKRAYQVGATIADGAREKAQKFRANRSISLTDYITGGGIGGTAGTAAGAMLAGPGGATVGGMLGAGTGALGNKWAREMGNPYIANIAQEFAQKFKGDPNMPQRVLKELLRLGIIKNAEQGE